MCSWWWGFVDVKIPVNLLAAQAMLEQNRRKRNNWLRKMKGSKAGASILVGDDVTLAEVVCWLEEAINETHSDAIVDRTE